MSKTYIYKLDSLSSEVHGVKCESKIVLIEDLPSYLGDGWFTSPQEASQKGEAAQVPDRDSLEAKANELGIKFDGRTNDKRLIEKIKQSIASLKD